MGINQNKKEDKDTKKGFNLRPVTHEEHLAWRVDSYEYIL